MKMKRLAIKMQLDPKQETAAVLDVFDDIGEYESFWTDEKRGFGATKVSAFLDEHPDVDTIKVRINSNGGDVFDGIAVHNLLKGSGKKIEVEVVGIAASIASVIAMSGEKVVMHPTSQMMVHNCWTCACGNANDFRKLADQMDQIMESSKTAYLEKAGDKLTAEKLTELLDGESYLTAKQCLEYGLCDEIYGKASEEEPEPAPEESIEKQEEKAPDVTPQMGGLSWLFM